jgi:FAD/FMN-containing dehydrogenase
MTSVRPTWSAERPLHSLAVALLGTLLVGLGFAVFDWSAGSSFADVRRLADGSEGTFAAVTQAYLKALYLPLLAVVLIAALGGTGRVGRVVVALAGAFAGAGLVAAVIWIESGSVGTGSSRGSALPLLAAMVAIGVVALALAVGAFFDDSGTLARVLAATLAVVAVLLHVYVVADLSSGGADPSAGAWLPAAGYALVAIAPALPHRRILHT